MTSDPNASSRDRSRADPEADPPDHSRQLVVDGDRQIDVLVDGQGPVIVLLPSSQRDSEDFDELARLIAAQGFKVLRPQPRGMGRSSPPPQHMTLSTLADDVALTVARLGEGAAVIVGHAFGHFTARVMDLEHPARVRGVVALGAAARSFPTGMAEALAIASDPKQPEADRLAGLRKAFFAPGSDPRVWLDGWHPELRQIYRTAGSQPPKDSWWPVGNAPILDLQGEQDPWRPESTRNELRDALGSKVTVRVIANASHAMIPEQPVAVATAIVDWVRSLDAGRDAGPGA